MHRRYHLPSLLWAGTPNCSLGKRVSFVCFYFLLVLGAPRLSPGIIPDTRGIFLGYSLVSFSLFSFPACFLGRGQALLGPRMLGVLPCILVRGSALAWLRSVRTMPMLARLLSLPAYPHARISLLSFLLILVRGQAFFHFT